jgi:hypothetical protein
MNAPPAPAPITSADRDALVALETAMWREATRFDPVFMQRHLAPDFFEFGRSGRRWAREAILAMPRHPIDVVLPLPDLELRALDAGTVLVTYRSEAVYEGVVEHARRSSIWSRDAAFGWVLRFHQGTPFEPAVTEP